MGFNIKDIQGSKLDFKTQPDFPEFQSPMGADGQLKNPFLVKAQPAVGFQSNQPGLDAKLGGINLNKQGLEAMRERATGSGDSIWGQLALQKQGLDQTASHDKNAAATAGSYATARNSMATGGGMSRGASERLARDEAKGLNSSWQDVERQGVQDRAGIRVQDQQMRDQFLSQLPGQEIAALNPEFQKTSMWAGMAGDEQSKRLQNDQSNRAYSTGIDQFNTQNNLGAYGALNTFNLGRYGEQMKGYAADKTAQATENSGKK